MGQNNSSKSNVDPESSRNTHITRDYDIRNKLGQGNFALVRRCTRKKDKKDFAVKIIHKKRLKKPKQQESLEREVNILKSIDHPNCVHLIQLYETQNHLYLVLELCQGGELFDMICKQGHFNEKHAAKVVTQITEALKYLHQKQIVHRDIKPENILLLEKSPESTVKLTDFGLANQLDGSDLKFWTSCGTLYYAAPEVLSNGSYNEKIDFWSLGVVLYVLLVGYLPFYHDKRAKTIDLIRRAQVPFDKEDWGHISKEARDLIKKLLVEKPEQRLGCDEILNHPWLKEATDKELEGHQANLQNYQKWRAKVQTKIQEVAVINLWKAKTQEKIEQQKKNEESKKAEAPSLKLDEKDNKRMEGEPLKQNNNSGTPRYVPGIGIIHE